MVNYQTFKLNKARLLTGEIVEYSLFNTVPYDAGKFPLHTQNQKGERLPLAGGFLLPLVSKRPEVIVMMPGPGWLSPSALTSAAPILPHV